MSEEEQSSMPSGATSSAPESGNKKLPLIIGSVIALALIGGGYYAWSARTKTVTTDDGKTIKYTETKDSVTASSEDGDMTIGTDISLPSDFPKDIPIYPGSKFTSSVNTADFPGYTATVNESAAKVIAWFKADYEKNGWKVVAQDATGLTVSNDTYIGGLVLMSDADGKCEFSISRMANSQTAVTSDEE